MNKEQIRERLMEFFNKGNGSSSGKLKLSQIHLCPRYQWFSLNEGNKPSNLETLGQYLKGLVWEDWLRREIFVDAEYQREVRLMGVRGFIDFFFPETSTVLEVKATNSSSVPFLPDLQHIYQVATYMLALKEEGVREPKGLILYIPVDKPSLMLETIWEVELEEEFELMLMERVREMIEATKREVEPNIPDGFRPESEPCSGSRYGKPFICPFHQFCWGEDSISIIAGEIVDELGDWVEVYEEIVGMFGPFMERRKWFEGKLKDWMKGNENSGKTVEVRGKRWRLILVKGFRKEVDLKGMREVFGDEPLKPFIKKIPFVRLKWEKIED